MKVRVHVPLSNELALGNNRMMERRASLPVNSYTNTGKLNQDCANDSVRMFHALPSIVMFCARSDSALSFKRKLVAQLRQRREFAYLISANQDDMLVSECRLVEHGNGRLMLDSNMLLETIFLFEDEPDTDDTSRMPELELIVKGRRWISPTERRRQATVANASSGAAARRKASDLSREDRQRRDRNRHRHRHRHRRTLTTPAHGTSATETSSETEEKEPQVLRKHVRVQRHVPSQAQTKPIDGDCSEADEYDCEDGLYLDDDDDDRDGRVDRDDSGNHDVAPRHRVADVFALKKACDSAEKREKRDGSPRYTEMRVRTKSHIPQSGDSDDYIKEAVQNAYFRRGFGADSHSNTPSDSSASESGTQNRTVRSVYLNATALANEAVLFPSKKAATNRVGPVEDAVPCVTPTIDVLREHFRVYSYNVIKINQRGRRQRRTLCLTKVSVQNIRGTKVTEDHAYEDVSSVFLLDSRTLVLSFWQDRDFTYESDAAKSIVREIHMRRDMLSEAKKRAFDASLDQISLKFQETLQRKHEVNLRAALRADTLDILRRRDALLRCRRPAFVRYTPMHCRSLVTNALLSRIGSNEDHGGVGDAFSDSPLSLLRIVTSAPKLASRFSSFQALDDSVDEMVLDASSEEGTARLRFIKNFNVFQKKPDDLLQTVRQFLDSLKEHIAEQRRRQIEQMITDVFPPNAFKLSLSSSRQTHQERMRSPRSTSRSTPVRKRRSSQHLRNDRLDSSEAFTPLSQSYFHMPVETPKTVHTDSANSPPSTTSTSALTLAAAAAESEAVAEADVRETFLLELIEESLQRTIVLPVYRQIYETTCVFTQQRDEILLAKVRQLRFKDQQFFGVPADQISPTKWRAASFELAFMDKSLLPVQKLQVLLNTARAIYATHSYERNREDDIARVYAVQKRRSLSMEIDDRDPRSAFVRTKDGAGDQKHTRVPANNTVDADECLSVGDSDEQLYMLAADEFFPIFVYVLVNTDIKHAEFSKAFMWGLCSKISLNGEAGYYLTVYEAALEYLINMDIEDVERNNRVNVRESLSGRRR